VTMFLLAYLPQALTVGPVLLAGESSYEVLASTVSWLCTCMYQAVCHRSDADMQEPSRPTATAPVHQQSAEMELDDDELLDMMGDMHPDPPPQPLLPASRLPPITNTLAGKHIMNAARTLFTDTQANFVIGQSVLTQLLCLLGVHKACFLQSIAL